MTEKELQQLALACVQQAYDNAFDDFERAGHSIPKDTRYISLAEQVTLDYRWAKVTELADTLQYLKERFGLNED